MGHSNPLSKMSGSQKIQFWEQKALSEGYGKDPAVTAKYDQMAQIGAGQKGKNGNCPPYEALRHALADIKANGSADSSASADASASASASASADSCFQSKDCQAYNGLSDFSLKAKLDLEGSLDGKSSDTCGCHCSKPSESDSCHPEGGLKADGNVVTTPGGYKIQSNAQHELTITGPDGKSSKIWGDPHVQGSDGNSFDFKKPSSFVLDDGTKIDVSTSQPSGKDGVTYATGAQITNGNDRVQISDMDKGPGKVGQVTQDGQQHAHDFDGNDVFKEAGNASHWGKDGKELTKGDKNGEYALGKDVDTSKVDQKLAGLQDTLDKGAGQDANDANPFAQKPYGDAQGLGDAMSQVKEMLALFSTLSQLFEQFQGNGLHA